MLIRKEMIKDANTTKISDNTEQAKPGLFLSEMFPPLPPILALLLGNVIQLEKPGEKFTVLGYHAFIKSCIITWYSPFQNSEFPVQNTH